MAAPELSIALAHLLRGPVHAEDVPAVWTSITSLGPQLREHLEVLGMRLVVDDVENYAYLRQLDELPEGMPRLVRRHALTFTATVLLILLRQQLATAESDGDTPRLIVTTEEMVESMRLYHRDGTSDEKIAYDITALVNLGYLRRLRGETDVFEVRRIIKALVTADWIAEFGDRLLQLIPSGENAADHAPDPMPDDADAQAAAATEGAPA
ncbi:DUF4194 domain-containing protein [Modestobacter sp. I12A-02628]|uniref:DUF4194 domain-containing protein n=2 Tax=Geodermatophilaceae TaxID=85030 RepID=A0A7K3WEA1_9ACTN|nr:MULTISPECIES: DUF4194 domain-containing protein [Geodermatophilaceae]MPQ99598.1 DUF4194 domain-containing protein [Goekera deserti]NDI46392.1 DUF4194 domain-containing protein [Goekera deserti]NEL54676.1 DUF4194 domain-containing protein [Goekera deserti]SFF45359.1 protein of unknown function [Blastococcus sp. DSM 46838]